MKKGTLVLVALFAAALAWYLLLGRHAKPQEDAAREARRIFHVDAKAISGIAIESPAGAIVLERGPNQTWRMKEPLNARADAQVAESAARAIAEIESTRTFRDERGAAGLDEMGLSNPRARVRFSLAEPAPSAPAPSATSATSTTEPATTAPNSSAPASFAIGNATPLTGSVYLRVGDGEEIVLAPASSVSVFLQPAADMRDKALVPAALVAIEEVRIVRPEGELRFQRRHVSDDTWWIEAPFEDLAEGSAVQSLISGIIGLRASAFPVEDQSDGHGLVPAKATVRLFGSGGTEIVAVRLGDDVPDQADQRYAASDEPGSAPGALAIVPTTDLAPLSKPASEFRSRRAVPFRTWDATGLTMTMPGIEMTFKKKDGLWSSVSAAGASASASPSTPQIEETLQRLSDLEIGAYDVAPTSEMKRLGLDPPRARFVLEFPAPAPPKTLLLGNEASPGQLYASVPGRPGIFTVPATIRERITGGAALYAEPAASPSAAPGGPADIGTTSGG